MRLIIETLEHSEELEFRCNGADMVADENLISLNFSVRKDYVRNDINVRGMIDMPLRLSAQYSDNAMWQLPAEVRSLIDQHLRAASDKVNRVL